MASLDLTISGSAFDAAEAETGFGFSATDNNCLVKAAVNNFDRFWGGFVFENVTIPQGATITAAYFSGYINPASDSTIDGTIWGNDVDSAADFSTEADVNGRTLTTANVDWSASITGDQYNDSPSIVDVIQEIVNRGSWASGNDLCLIIAGNAAGGDVLAYIYAYDTGPGTAPAKLHIEYTETAADLSVSIDPDSTYIIGVKIV
jgi:hypothetical protein